jgi:hypothetical protein
MAQPPPLYPYWNDSQTDLLRKILTNTVLIAEGIPSGGSPAAVVPVPASSGSPGAANQIAWDGSYVYFYIVGTGWRRTPVDDWS